MSTAVLQTKGRGQGGRVDEWPGFIVELRPGDRHSRAFIVWTGCWGEKNPKKCKERSEGDLVNFLVSSDGSRFRKGNTISSLIVWIQGEVVGPCVL